MSDPTAHDIMCALNAVTYLPQVRAALKIGLRCAEAHPEDVTRLDIVRIKHAIELLEEP